MNKREEDHRYNSENKTKKKAQSKKVSDNRYLCNTAVNSV